MGENVLLKAVVITVAACTFAILDSVVSAEPVPGYLTGRVEDAASGKGLPYTNISFNRVTEWLAGSVQAGGVMTAMDGRFTASVKPGTYRLECRYISYKNEVLENIVVRSGETTHVVAKLTLAALAVETVKVRAARLADRESSLLDKQKKSDAITDAIGAEQIARTTDSNAAEAVDRVSGTTVEDGKYVYVRGLGDRYSSAQVNGSNVGAPEANKRVLPLDIFPVGVLDNIVIQKTYSPDMDGEFGGGVVNINTKQNLDRRAIESSLSLGLSSRGAPGGGFMSYPGGWSDFLGIDDGTRALPDRVSQIAGTARVTRNGFSIEDRAAMGGSFKNTWTPSNTGAQPNFSYSGLYADKFEVAGRPLGILMSMALSNGFETTTKENNSYQGTIEAPEPKFLYDVQESSANVLGGITGSLNYKTGERSFLNANVLYTRDSEDRVWISEGPNTDYGNESVLQRQLGYIERGLLSTAMKGEHETWYEGSKLDWQLSYSEGSRNELDRRLSVYEWNPVNQVHELSRRFAQPLTRVFGISSEYDRTFKANWLFPMGTVGFLQPSFKTGFATSYRNRDSEYRRFGFSVRGTQAGDRSLPPEELLTQANLDAGTVLFEELTLPNDSWYARQYLTAAYGMLDTRLNESLRLTAGARFEQSTMDVSTGSPFVNGPTERAKLETDDLLPAASLTWNVTRRQNLRAAWSRTLNRPQLRELSPFDMFNYEEFYAEIGNPQLQNAELTSYDLRWEMYPSSREYLGVSVFHKDMDQPIQTLLSTRVTGEALVPVNGREGDLTGAEFEARASLGRLWQLFGAAQPTALRHWAWGFNYARVESRVVYEGFEAPLTGQSSYSANAGVFFTNHRFNSNLLYKTAGKRLHAFTAGELADVYAYPMQSLDYTFGARIGRSMLIKFQLENILNDPMTYKQGDLVVRRWLEGRGWNLSLRYNV
ncbi:MAG TPA: TonB-dependent receptor [Candidatus Krumholzibacteria bacterium]|nr:TonB-dependent receptor [Candidatus Krumholzibacteria bacterium]